MKKVIGIPGYKLGDNSFGAGIHYLDFISKFGDPRIIMPWETEVAVDALLLPGGPDVTPNVFSQVVGYHTGNACAHRQAFYDRELGKYVAADIPIFGICLGFQMLNVFFEGSLTQHLYTHKQSSGRGAEGHTVELYQTPFHKKEKKYGVNSHHHQAVTRDDLSKFLTPLASVFNDDDMTYTEENNYIVESFVHKTKRIAGVQWHPEEYRDPFAMALFDYVLNKEK